MPYNVFVFKPDGTMEQSETPKPPDYAFLRKSCQGIIQQVPYLTSITVAGVEYIRGSAWINEEGIIIGLPFNFRATELWREWPRSVQAYGGDKRQMQLFGNMVFYAKRAVPKTIASADKSPRETRMATIKRHNAVNSD